ncbi:hypothetical protein L1987_13620 [Smallanthus sonchifolius]|uniref:Uncharacterized protein n=1 Tax=Smallanthus sonchifolius TaxID=185202 RepID=A0ACB9JHY8_9ASTR|nr:hypothetical protein L1987_13620 [Smallanthus sonchifolius]
MERWCYHGGERSRLHAFGRKEYERKRGILGIWKVSIDTSWTGVCFVAASYFGHEIAILHRLIKVGPKSQSTKLWYLQNHIGRRLFKIYTTKGAKHGGLIRLH